jgi:predicted kinase
MGVQVASPRARPCGSADIKSKDRYLKEELVALAKASGIDHKQNMDQLCDALGIKPHVNEVFLPKKPCNSKARGSERYTKEEVVELARSRGLDVRGKNMDALCSALGIEQTFPYLAPPRMFDEYI